MGVIGPIDPRVRTAGQARDRALEAAAPIEPARLGSCDDCGFTPFGDDTSTGRETAFAKIRARLAGHPSCREHARALSKTPASGGQAAS